MIYKQRRFAALAAGVGVLFVAQPAWAQQTDTADPDTAPAEDTGFGGLDFGGVVVIQEDGSVIWTQTADTADAGLTDVDGSSADPAAQTRGVDGTGSIETQAGSTDVGAAEPASRNDPLDSSDAAGTGNSFALMAALAGAAVFVLAAGAFYLRSRGQSEDDLVMIEDVLDGMDAEPAVDDGVWVAEPEPAYAGAEDAGAYEAGGAAYAQHSTAADPSIDAEAMAASAAQASTQSRFDQDRKSVV